MSQPDGSEKAGEASPYALSLAGRGLVLAVIEDVTRADHTIRPATVVHS
jgi:hypothetical protein